MFNNMEPPTREHLTLEERQLVLKVENYFNLEKENGGPLPSIMAVQKRTADLCGISQKTLQNLHKMDREGQLGKKYKRRRLLSKSLDLTEGVKYEIRNVVYEIYKAKEVKGKH